MALSYLLLMFLLLQAGGARPPDAPSPSKPSTTAPILSSPAEKKRLGPPAGTPGRAVNVYVVVSVSGTPSSVLSDDPRQRGAVETLTQQLQERGVNVVDGTSVLALAAAANAALAAANLANPTLFKQPIHENPELLRLLNIDAVLMASVTTNVRNSGTGIGRLGISSLREVEAKVDLLLRGPDGMAHAAASSSRRGRQPQASAALEGGRDDSSLNVTLTRDAAAESLKELLAKVELAPEP